MAEKIMPAVMSVNGCQHCARFHGALILDEVIVSALAALFWAIVNVFSLLHRRKLVKD